MATDLLQQARTVFARSTLVLLVYVVLAYLAGPEFQAYQHFRHMSESDTPRLSLLIPFPTAIICIITLSAPIFLPTIKLDNLTGKDFLRSLTSLATIEVAILCGGGALFAASGGPTMLVWALGSGYEQDDHQWTALWMMMGFPPKLVLVHVEHLLAGVTLIGLAAMAVPIIIAIEKMETTDDDYYDWGDSQASSSWYESTVSASTRRR